MDARHSSAVSRPNCQRPWGPQLDTIGEIISSQCPVSIKLQTKKYAHGENRFSYEVVLYCRTNDPLLLFKDNHILAMPFSCFVYNPFKSTNHLRETGSLFMLNASLHWSGII